MSYFLLRRGSQGCKVFSQDQVDNMVALAIPGDTIHRIPMDLVTFDSAELFRQRYSSAALVALVEHQLANGEFDRV